MMRRLPRAVLAGIGLLLAATAAHALVPVADYLFDKVPASWRERPALAALLTVTTYDAEGREQTDAGKLLATLAGRAQGRFEYTFGAEQQVVVYNREGVKTRPAPLPAHPRHLLHRFLMAAYSRADLESLVRELRVDAGVTAFTRLDLQPCVVLGAAEGQLDRPQLWFSYPQLFPVRVIAFAGERKVDLILADYDHPATADAFPGRIELTVDGKPAERYEIESVERSPALPRDLFQAP